MSDVFHPNNMRNFKNIRETSFMAFFPYHKKHSHTLWHVLIDEHTRRGSQSEGNAVLRFEALWMQAGEQC